MFPFELLNNKYKEVIITIKQMHHKSEQSKEQSIAKKMFELNGLFKITFKLTVSF